MFGCVAGRRARIGWFVAAFAALAALSARSAFAQTGGFPVEEPASPAPPPAPIAPPPIAPPPAPIAPVAPMPAPIAPPPAEVAPPVYPGPVYPGALPPVADSSLPPILPYRDGLPVPRGYHVEKRSASGLILTGALTLSVGYAVGLGIGLDKGFDGSLGWLVVPVFGAWPAVAGRDIRCTAEVVEEAKACLYAASKEATTVALVAVDGMVQTTGLLLLLAGLASGQPELVRDGIGDVHVTAGRRREGGFELGLEGRF